MACRASSAISLPRLTNNGFVLKERETCWNALLLHIFPQNNIRLRVTAVASRMLLYSFLCLTLRDTDRPYSWAPQTAAAALSALVPERVHCWSQKMAAADHVLATS